MTEPLVRARGLTVRYGRAVALAGVDLDVLPGRVTALIGPSGAGKSTLLAAVARLTDLVPGARVEGRVFLGGEPLERVPARELRRRVGMVFQRPNPFPLSVRENVELALADRGASRRDRRLAAEGALREVGLWEEVRERLGAPALGLSGGQQQRLCMARALALRPELLLMDEPCSALDPLAAERVEQLVRELCGRYTIVIVTHNLAQARRLAHDVAVLWVRDGAGRVIESGSAADVLDRPREPETRAYVEGRLG